jgi:Pyruvate/2-oxoacid:ferredoxin oxidoreductase gamma subunit
VMLGAFVASTSLVSAESLVGAMRAALPPHRRRMVDTNAALLRLGTDFIRCGGSNDAGLSTRNSGM